MNESRIKSYISILKTIFILLAVIVCNHSYAQTMSFQDTLDFGDVYYYDYNFKRTNLTNSGSDILLIRKFVSPNNSVKVDYRLGELIMPGKTVSLKISPTERRRWWMGRTKDSPG